MSLRSALEAPALLRSTPTLARRAPLLLNDLKANKRAASSEGGEVQAINQVVNSAEKTCHMSGGNVPRPVVFRGAAAGVAGRDALVGSKIPSVLASNNAKVEHKVELVKLVSCFGFTRSLGNGLLRLPLHRLSHRLPSHLRSLYTSAPALGIIKDWLMGKEEPEFTRSQVKLVTEVLAEQIREGKAEAEQIGVARWAKGKENVESTHMKGRLKALALDDDFQAFVAVEAHRLHLLSDTEKEILEAVEHKVYSHLTSFHHSLKNKGVKIYPTTPAELNWAIYLLLRYFRKRGLSLHRVDTSEVEVGLFPLDND